MRRVLRPRGKLLIVEAHNPRHGLAWQLLGRAHRFDRMARTHDLNVEAAADRAAR